MIFHKILGGSALAFELSLDKKEFRPGENVRGTLSVKVQKSVKARQLLLFAQGKESTIITVSESNNTYSTRHRATRIYDSAGMNYNRTGRTYSEINTFFSQDLSYLLQEAITRNTLQDGTLEILPQEKEIAFNFTLPSETNLFSSYKGKHANITYTIKATADIANKLDINKEEQFLVVNPKNNKVISYSNNYNSNNDYITSSQEDDESNNIVDTHNFEKQNDTIAASSLNEERNKQIRKENYSDRFERIFGREAAENTPTSSRQPPRYYTVRGTMRGTGINIDLGTIFAKDRSHFLKENTDAKIDLLDHEKTITSYSRGGKIKGEMVLPLTANLGEIAEKNNNKIKKLRGMKITLTGIENAFAQGLQRTNTIEKYEEDIEVKSHDTRQNVGNNEVRIPFEFRIPEAINQSYIGKFSEYFWGLEAKVNIAWSSDITARAIIEIAG